MKSAGVCSLSALWIASESMININQTNSLMNENGINWKFNTHFKLILYFIHLIFQQENRFISIHFNAGSF